MTKFYGAIRITGLALAVLFVQACQRTEQPASETAATPAAPPAAAPAPSTASRKPAPAAPAAPAAASKPAPSRALTLDSGTTIRVRPAQTLSTKTLKTGDGFNAVLEDPLTAGGRTLFPKGAMVMGRVVESDPGGRVKGVASLAVALDMLHTADGKMFNIATNTVSVEANTSKTKDATKVAVGSAVGAAIGAIAGGGKGAGIGAATGAGAGTAVVLGTRGDAAEIASETVLQFSLTSPLTVSQ